MNLFQTDKAIYQIPNEVMRRAIILSPNKDWTDKRTSAYKYLKQWALEQDKKHEPRT